MYIIAMNKYREILANYVNMCYNCCLVWFNNQAKKTETEFTEGEVKKGCGHF